MRAHDSIPHSHPSFRLVVLTFVLLGLAATRARADDDVDVASFEYVDVIETVEGSILRGVVTEQTPNVTYKLATADGSLHVIRAASIVKISKQRNSRYRAPVSRSKPDAPSESSASVASVAGMPVVDEDESSVSSARSAMPSAGLRIEPELAIVIPTGDLVNVSGSPLSYRTSFAPAITVGYEHDAGNLGLAVGGLTRYTSWQLPVEIAMLGSHWTLETQVYGRATLQLGRAMPYAGIAIGVDTNHTVNHTNGVTSTAIGLGANVQAGVTFAASQSLLLGVGADYHPGTDTIEEGWDASISYFALRLGVTVRL